MFAIWPDWSEERIPLHPLWRSKGLWRGRESSSRQVSDTCCVWNCRDACFWVCEMFLAFPFGFDVYFARHMRSGVLPWVFIQKRCRQLAIPRLEMCAIYNHDHAEWYWMDVEHSYFDCLKRQGQTSTMRCNCYRGSSCQNFAFQHPKCVAVDAFRGFPSFPSTVQCVVGVEAWTDRSIPLPLHIRLGYGPHRTGL